MAEEQEEGSSFGAQPDTGGLAQEMALAGASRARADAFLEDQRDLISIQKHHLHEQFKSLRLTIWEKRAGMLLRVATAFVGFAFASFAGVVLWNAAHAEGLVIDSFSVPPDLAARGLTGQVIAGQLSDKLAAMQDATHTNRAARSYSNDWGNEIRVEIPQTGISVSEAWRFLKSSLGNETHISGDVWRSPEGIAIATRMNGGSTTVTGKDTDLDGLIQQAAEAIYKFTQPYRYAYYLANVGRHAEAIPLFKSLTATGDKNDRGWAYVGWSNALLDIGSMAERENLLKQSLAYGILTGTTNLANLEINLGRPEVALAYFRKASALPRGGDMNPQSLPLYKLAIAAAEAAIMGDFQTAVRQWSAAAEGGIGVVGGTWINSATYQIRNHDLAEARKTLNNVVPITTGSIAPGNVLIARLNLNVLMAQEAGDWKAALAHAQAMEPVFQKYPGRMSNKPTLQDPQTAIVEAQLGKFTAAEARLRPMPADCYPCLRARAQVADMQGQHDRADWWFARAVASNPSILFAEQEWGQALIARGRPDEAIAKFTASNKKGPHFADALEGWGEALMAKNQSHRALAKFEEAEKYAPNWGRLHLKWGEALVYAGKPEEAKKQFARAAALDLTPSEKQELAWHP